MDGRASLTAQRTPGAPLRRSQKEAVTIHGMKYVIRAFFRTLRRALGPFMLLSERLTRPKGVVRSAEAQAAVALQCQQLALYQYATCPFCIKVRQHMAKLSLPIERRDAQHNDAHRNDLLAQGGVAKVPCLRIDHPDGQTEWLYESTAIMARLDRQFVGG